MWPKNLVLFALPSKIEIDADAIEAKRFDSPTSLQWESSGFIQPFTHTGYVCKIRDNALLRILTESKILPAATIRDAVEVKAAEISEREQRAVGKKEKLSIKEQVTDDLLPRALTRKSAANIWFLGDYVAVDLSSQPKAENAISTIREALPPFPSSLIRTVRAPHEVMTSWVKGGVDTGRFELASECELADASEDGAKIKATHFDLTSNEIQNHLAVGKQVTKLGLVWDEKIRFVLTDTLQIKSIKFLDILQEEASQGADDSTSLFDATAAIISLEIQELIQDLIAALGGLADKNNDKQPSAQPVSESEEDPLYSEAVKVVKNEQRASISTVQRYLQIGYNRAARMIEQMENDGIVSHMDKSGARKVLVK